MIADRESLESLGFKLRDCGAYWQANAAHRGGDNPTALQIYKETGVWIDYTHGCGKPLPFSVLMKKMGKDAAVQTITEKVDQYMKVPKTYDQSCLSRLLPHYSFYNKRGISDSTLKLYRGGLATQGKMYQRFTFPIFNKDGKIHGFDGRDMLDKPERPKWKKLGTCSQFVYPFFMVDKEGKRTMDDSVVDFSTLFIVESIGDSLSMSEHGYKNHLVAFGGKMSNTMLSKIIELNPRRIFVCLNNDSDKKVNVGETKAKKIYAALLPFFSEKSVKMALPHKNDFGDMNADDYAIWRKTL